MGEIVSIAEARQLRRRRRATALNARCRELIAASLETWRSAYLYGAPGDRAVCLQRMHVLGELLTAADRLT
jgi:hypothetical protein